MSQTPLDQRHATRHSVRILVEFPEAAGVTEDASVSGIFVRTAVPLPPDTELHFTLVFPTAPADPPFRLPARGRVVRSEPRPDGWATALTLVPDVL